MKNGLASSVNWVTFDTNDVQKAREILKDLGPDSTVDSIGLGMPFEEISNIFFPATSTLHTRLRYQIFVPAIFYKMYIESDRRIIKNPSKRLYDLEVDLMNVLLKNDPDGGVVGRVAREGLKYWPSQTYWGAISSMKIFGKENINKLRLFDDYMHKGRNKVKNDDGEVEGDVPRAIEWDFHFQNISSKLICNNSFHKKVTFDLTKEEALFLKGKLREVSIGSDTLLNMWTNLPESKINPIGNFLEITETGNQKLDRLIHEAKNYSLVSMGITHAYRYALCDHRANKVFKNFPDKKKDWNEYAKKNIENLNRWAKKNKILKNWNILYLKKSLLEYSSDKKIDSMLIKMVDKFTKLWRSTKNSDQLANGFVTEVIKQEEYRRRNRSHFIDPLMTIPENTKGENYRDFMFDFRFTQGKDNALDIVKALRRKK